MAVAKVPIAGFAQLQGEQYSCADWSAVRWECPLSGGTIGGLDEAEAIGRLIAEDLLAQGADRILQALFH